MRLTKLGHACVRLEKDGGALVIDPGAWSGRDVLAGAQAVLVTHEHPDHLDGGEVRAALTADPGLGLWANSSVAAQFADFGGRVHEVAHGDVFTAAGFDVHAYGQDHAVIMPGETRRELVRSLRMLATKRESLPPKKHGNIPL